LQENWARRNNISLHAFGDRVTSRMTSQEKYEPKQ